MMDTKIKLKPIKRTCCEQGCWEIINNGTDEDYYMQLLGIEWVLYALSGNYSTEDEANEAIEEIITGV